ncbi:MAG: 5-(carboxyamino)imidazole ribonucleotide synthase [Chloroflexota bacterium]
MRVGVLGGGQLGRMLALAGLPLGLQFRFLDPEPSACAADIGELVVGNYEDTSTVDAFLRGVDCVTYEFENVPVDVARYVANRVPLYPSPRSLEVAQDRLAEKTLFQSLGIATAGFKPVDQRSELDAALGEIGVPAILKTRRLGYDGKGQMQIRTLDEADQAWAELGGQPLILEERVVFARELSILVARGLDGKTAFYPLTENHHRDGILRLSLAPAPGITLDLQNIASRIGHAVLRELDHVGMLAIELFQVPGGLMANEIAPRVHNSGHWTIEGSVTSQFENHLRAVLGLPLGDITTIGRSAMLNFIGAAPATADLASVSGAHLHLYRKTPRPGRKVGHVTLVGTDEAGMMPKMAAIQRMMASPAEPDSP